MTPPPFRVGDGGIIGGLRWRVVVGAKADGDMVVEIQTGGWERVKMGATLLLADFHYQVEDILYGHKRGGEYILAAIASAVRKDGHLEATRKIEMERNHKMRPAFPVPYNGEHAPYEHDQDEGRRVGALRTSLTSAMWVQGDTAEQIAGSVSDVLARYGYA